jgi:hypothetical protein
MKTQTKDAMARLRQADPAHDEMPPARHVPIRRRLVFSTVAAAAGAAVIGAVVAGVDQGSAAWAVDPAPGGGVAVQIHPKDFTDPAALNKELRHRGIRTVVMLQSARGACRIAVPADPRIWRGADRIPWKFRADDAKTISVVIHPDRIPAREELLMVLGRLTPTMTVVHPASSRERLVQTPQFVAPLVVQHIPSCAPNLEYDASYGPNGLTPRD